MVISNLANKAKQNKQIPKRALGVLSSGMPGPARESQQENEQSLSAKEVPGDELWASCLRFQRKSKSNETKEPDSGRWDDLLGSRNLLLHLCCDAPEDRVFFPDAPVQAW